MFIKGPPANGGDASRGQQLKSDQPVTPQQPLTVVPPSADDQVARCDAEASLPTETNSDGRVVVGKVPKSLARLAIALRLRSRANLKATPLQKL